MLARMYYNWPYVLMNVQYGRVWWLGHGNISPACFLKGRSPLPGAMRNRRWGNADWRSILKNAPQDPTFWNQVDHINLSLIRALQRFRTEHTACQGKSIAAAAQER